MNLARQRRKRPFSHFQKSQSAKRALAQRDGFGSAFRTPFM